MTRRLWIAGVLIFAPAALWAQKERADIRAGNRAYYEGKYPEAEVGYKRAIEKNISSYEANFNLAGALYKQGRYDDAAATYQKLAQDGTDTERQASTYYNMGNTYVKQRKLDEAIEAYKNALRLTPDDKEAKFNLAYAKKLKQDEDKKNDQNQNQDQNQDRNQNGGGGGNDDRNDLFPIWWKRRTFFSNRRTGGKRVYRDIYRSSGKISCDRIGSAGSESG